MRMVMPMKDSVSASPSGTPQPTSASATGPASVAAPNAAEKKPASVTPTWTAARNRLGSPTSLASRSPRAPRSVSALTWLSRNETSAISAAEKHPPSSTNASTSRAFTSVPLIRVSVRSQLPGQPGSTTTTRPEEGPVRLLVTGGAGYIGSVVTLHLLRAGHRVTVLDDLSTGHADAVPDDATLVTGTLEDATAGVLDAGDPYDGVLHFAAKALVGESVEHPERYWRTNVVGTLALLEAMRAAAVPRLVFSSTAATYGEPDEVP